VGENDSRPSGGLAAPERPRFTGVRPRVDDEGDRFAVVKIRFEIPHRVFIYPFTRTHPDVLVLITASQHLTDGRLLAEVTLVEPQPVDHTDDVRKLDGVLSVAREGPVEAQTRYQLIVTEPCYLLLVDELEVLLRYPRTAQNGLYLMEVASRVSQLRTLVERLRKIAPEVTVLAFGRDRLRSAPRALTPRQHALLHQALSAGYFDVPRRISLTGFAEKLGRSKSSVSHALALVEKALAEGGVAATA
jgi:predicted DNA binding protein